MKNVAKLIITVFVLIFFTACGNKEEIVDELIYYYNEEWISIQAMKNKEMRNARYRLLNFQEETEEYEEGEESLLFKEEIIELLIEDALPVSNQVVDRFESTQLKHKEVKRLNNMKVEAEKFAKAALEKLIDYYNGEISEYEVKEEQYELNKKYDEVNDYLEKLMEKYNLEYNSDKGSVDGFYELKRAED